ncbi:hypothetical protein CJ030_MR7G015231 [Morella rubra]|uniref:Uncharacterized protein n=1 Tax=Morella rubra TaxID=262757 RepID=A0A6A1UWY8_9ROSI|nr:hypothetical protein CJ030_MR7G015231 [Morella rubra]
MPFINTHSGSCRQACKDLQDKVAKRVAGWKARALSQAGRTVLIQAVASAMPSYFMAVFLLPKEVLRDIDRVFKNFWWGFKDDTQRHYHPEAWSAICVPQELGGLGLRRMEDINKALLAQLGWKFLSDENALWVKALNAKYFGSADFLSLSRRGATLGPGVVCFIFKILSLQVYVGRSVMEVSLTFGVRHGFRVLNILNPSCGWVFWWAELLIMLKI